MMSKMYMTRSIPLFKQVVYLNMVNLLPFGPSFLRVIIYAIHLLEKRVIYWLTNDKLDN